MKKNLAKLVLLIIVSTFIVANTAFAITTTPEPKPTTSPIAPTPTTPALPSTKGLDTALNDIADFPCLDLSGEDKQFVHQIIEEPLLTTNPEPKYEKGVKVFESRVCKKNTFSYTINGNEYIDTVLATKCSKNAFDLANSNNSQAQTYKVKFFCQEVQVLLSRGGTSLLQGYIGTLYTWAASVVGLISVLVIIISGIQISFAGDDSGVIESAKGRIVKSLSGLALLFLSGLILYTINPNFFV